MSKIQIAYFMHKLMNNKSTVVRKLFLWSAQDSYWSASWKRLGNTVLCEEAKGLSLRYSLVLRDFLDERILLSSTLSLLLISLSLSLSISSSLSSSHSLPLFFFFSLFLYLFLSLSFNIQFGWKRKLKHCCKTE